MPEWIEKLMNLTLKQAWGFIKWLLGALSILTVVWTFIEPSVAGMVRMQLAQYVVTQEQMAITTQKLDTLEAQAKQQQDQTKLIIEQQKLILQLMGAPVTTVPNQ